MIVAISNRKQWIDALRGIAILLVLYGHCLPFWDEYFIYTSPIKIPLFFAITGFVLNTQKDEPKFFFKKWLKRLVIPYFLLAIIPVVIFIPITPISGTVEKIEKILNGETFWFMPCMIIGNLVFYLYCHFVKKIYLKIAIAFICSIVGYILAQNHVLDFCFINVAFEIQFFYIIGYFLKHYMEHITSYYNVWILVVPMAIIYILICMLSSFVFPSQSLDVHLSYYYNIPVCLVLILLGLGCLFFSASRIYKWPRFLIFVGQNSLILYMWAGFVWIFVDYILYNCGITIPKSIFGGILKATGQIVICSCVALIINKHLPILVGKNKPK